jgi:putative salt-induced outer membrane protein YdiY
MNTLITVIVFKFLIIVTLYFGQLAQADVLILNNGDQITGDIKRIWNSKISIEPEYSDEFKVDMSAVNHIKSNRDFEIELNDGTSMVANLVGVGSDGNQIVRTTNDSISVPLAQFSELNEPGKDFIWKNNIDFSAALNKGNTDSSNTKLRTDIIVKLSNHRHIGEVAFFREKLVNVLSKDQDLFKYSYNWFFRDLWFFSTQLSFERDPIIALNRRVILSTGLGSDIWATSRRTLSMQVGAGVQIEEIGLSSRESAVLTWSLRYRQDFFSDDIELYHNHSVTSNLSGRTNTSYKTTTGLRHHISDLFYVNLVVDFDYETNPVDVAENEDIALLVGFGAGF